jgi:hypothetical protein
MIIKSGRGEPGVFHCMSAALCQDSTEENSALIPIDRSVGIFQV